MAQLIFSGLQLGAIYALAALGFVMVFRATGRVNFAQGDMMTASAFISLWAVQTLHLPILVAWIVAGAAMALVGVLMYYVIYRPLRNKAMITVAIATLGVALMLRGGLTVVFGQNPSALPSPVGDGVISIGGLIVSKQSILILSVTLVLILGQAFVIQRTFIGKSLRAISEDETVARLLGLPVNALLIGTVVYGAILAALAGVLLAPITSVSLNLGWELGLTAFGAAIIGGFGSMTGALLGGFVVGLAYAFGSRYIPNGYGESVIYVAILIVLLVRPQGLVSVLPGRKV